MKIKTFCWSLLVIGAAVVNARGESFRTDINPALVYSRAFLVAPDLSQADSDYLFTNEWQGQKLPERCGKLIAGYDRQFELVRQAARSTVPCDWGIDMSAGPATLLPHLARAKSVAVTTRLRVMWHLQNGRQAEACDEWLAAFALGRNVASDGLLISSLVQMASETICCSAIAANFGRFSPESLKQLAAGLEAAPTRRTMAACVPTEKALFLDGLLRKILELQQQHPGNDAKVMEGIHHFLGYEDLRREGETHLWARLTQAAGGTSEGVLKLLREHGQLFESSARFLALPYPEYESQVKAFSKEIENSPNPLIAEIIPGIIKARQREFRTLAYLAMVRAAVEYKLHGEPGLKSVSDPCGHGPFTFRRFSFEGVDRGFELTSAFNMGNNKAVLIFVEKEGPPFRVDGNYPGQALPKAAPQQ